LARYGFELVNLNSLENTWRSNLTPIHPSLAVAL